MNQVITTEQAKQITGGRTPLMPVEYETAVNALTACLAIDEAKIWSDKADALAAWAKIYHSPDAERKAKLLKLHAYRRMGELARELRPKKKYATAPSNNHRSGVTPVQLPGAHALLKDSGLTHYESATALRLSRATKEEFESLADVPNPPSPSGARVLLTGERGEIGELASRLSMLASVCRAVPPRKFLQEISSRRSSWRDGAEEIYAWLTVVLQKRN